MKVTYLLKIQGEMQVHSSGELILSLGCAISYSYFIAKFPSKSSNDINRLN
jgi:hypothetical protein